MGAEGKFTVGLSDIYSDAGFEPLAVFFDQRNQCDWNAEKPCGKCHDPVKRTLRWRVQNFITTLEGITTVDGKALSPASISAIDAFKATLA